jgi:hypothetical protein
VVTEVDGEHIESIDGGQTDKLNNFRDTAIRRVVRRFEKGVGGWWLTDGCLARRCNWLFRASCLLDAPEAS